MSHCLLSAGQQAKLPNNRAHPDHDRRETVYSYMNQIYLMRNVYTTYHIFKKRVLSNVLLVLMEAGNWRHQELATHVFLARFLPSITSARELMNPRSFPSPISGYVWNYKLVHSNQVVGIGGQLREWISAQQRLAGNGRVQIDIQPQRLAIRLLTEQFIF